MGRVWRGAGAYKHKARAFRGHPCPQCHRKDWSIVTRPQGPCALCLVCGFVVWPPGPAPEVQ